ncbi:MAG: serine hydrolase domain-containing protein [Pseudomonadota bacterium]|nr:serine hydrolase domain-containing protein [Pseudomonadota bacterium]
MRKPSPIRRLISTVLLVAAASCAQADEIDDYINAEVARQQVPGLALAIMRHGELVRAQGYGFANLEHHVPVHPDTLFQSGAVGMQFTAVAVMLLVEDGKLRLDESVRTYLPEAPRSWQPITLRQMLNHTSGLATTPSGEFRRDYSDEELLAIIYGQPLNFRAGTRWSFSYTGYLTLGMLIKRVSGEFYADLLARRLFAPLGMHTARLIDYRAVIPNRAEGYEATADGLRHPEWISPTANSTADGSLYLSVLDYARWEAGVFGRKVLKPESWAEIAQPARIASGRTYPYGLGWYLEHSAGQDIWRHAGRWQGFNTFIIRYLGDELTIVALANGDGGDAARIARHVAGLLDAKLAQPAGAPLQGADLQLTDRIKEVVREIAAGKPNYADFAFISRPEFDETMVANRLALQPLGRLQEIALLSSRQLGDDQVYRFRARYDQGPMDVNVTYTPGGKIAGLEFIRVHDWDAPMQE